MKTLFNTLLLLGTLPLAGNCLADWSGGIEAGARLGSSDRPALRIFAANQSDPLSHYMFLDWNRSAGNNNYRLGYNPRFQISHSVYSFGQFSVEEDDEAGVKREIDALLGIGNNLFKRGSTQVKVEAGLGARQLTSSITSNASEDGFVFLAGNMSTGILPFVRLAASVDTRAGSDRTTLDGEAGISIPIGPGTALSYVYNVNRNNIDGAENIVNEDSSFKISYGFSY